MSETKTKFTPGPWHVSIAGHYVVSLTDGNLFEAAKIVASVRTNRDDANLISAAPDMYKALEDELKMRTSAIKAIEAHHNGTLSLEEFEHVITGIFTGSFVGDLTRAALSKARGEKE